MHLFHFSKKKALSDIKIAVGYPQVTQVMGTEASDAELGWGCHQKSATSFPGSLSGDPGNEVAKIWCIYRRFMCPCWKFSGFSVSRRLMSCGSGLVGVRLWRIVLLKVAYYATSTARNFAKLCQNYARIPNYAPDVRNYAHTPMT